MVPNMQNMMKQMQKMQKEMEKVQEGLKDKSIASTSGGGAVTVEFTGDLRCVKMEIKPDVIDPEDVEMLQDLIVAAVNEGIKNAQNMASDEMGKVTGNLKVPGMPGLF